MQGCAACIPKNMFDTTFKKIQNGANKQFGSKMPNLSIKDVPEAWAVTLRQRALRNHRSLQGELMAIIEQAVQDGPLPPRDAPLSGASSPTRSSQQGTVIGYDRQGHPIMRYGWKTIEQIAAELQTKYPEPVRGAPLAVDIIREDRDSR